MKIQRGRWIGISMSHVVGLPKGASTTLDLSTGFLDGKFFPSFLTRESRACPRASCRYDVENGTRSLARLVDFRLLSAFDSFWREIKKRNGDLCC